MIPSGSMYTALFLLIGLAAQVDMACVKEDMSKCMNAGSRVFGEMGGVSPTPAFLKGWCPKMFCVLDCMATLGKDCETAEPDLFKALNKFVTTFKVFKGMCPDPDASCPSPILQDSVDDSEDDDNDGVEDREDDDDDDDGDYVEDLGSEEEDAPEDGYDMSGAGVATMAGLAGAVLPLLAFTR